MPQKKSAPTGSHAGEKQGPGDENSAFGKSDPSYETLQEAKEKLTAILNEMGDKADGIEKKLRERLSTSELSFKDEIALAEEKIREKPVLAVGLAAAAGLLIGLLLNRKK